MGRGMGPVWFQAKEATLTISPLLLSAMLVASFGLGLIVMAWWFKLRAPYAAPGYTADACGRCGNYTLYLNEATCTTCGVKYTLR